MGSNILASATGTITEVEKGEKGAVERPRSWDDIADGSSIESGSDGEKWLDIVLYGDNWYQCIKSFTKGNGVVPSNTIYFKNITDYKRLATGLFLASKAYIHNLGVDNILITDQGEGKGNVLLKADKDGIECKSGKFENVTVSGEVNATSGSIGNMTISGALGVSENKNGVVITKNSFNYYRYDSIWTGASTVSIDGKEDNLVYIRGTSDTNTKPVVKISKKSIFGIINGTALEVEGDLEMDGQILNFKHHVQHTDGSINVTSGCYVYGGSSGKDTFYLPNDVYLGTVCVICNEGTSTLTICVGSSSDKKYFWAKGYTDKIQSKTLATGDIAYAIKTGNYWHVL